MNANNNITPTTPPKNLKEILWTVTMVAILTASGSASAYGLKGIYALIAG